MSWIAGIIKPIYELTRNGGQRISAEEQQIAFDEIKCRLVRPSVLHLPDSKGTFHLYSDTSKFTTGSALYQIQNWKPILITYASKRLSETASNFLITKLEMCGLSINTASFVHLLKREDFNAIVDHLALTHIFKSKAEPTTTRINRLLEILSSYSFNLYYIKGKDKVISDFVSRQRHGNSNPHEIISISFNIQSILQSKYYNTGKEKLGNI